MKNITITTSKGYQLLTPDEGYRITKWNEGENIRDYYSTTEVCAPLSADVSMYHPVTVAQDKVYQEQRRKAHEEERERRKKETKMRRKG